jgi:hypothetical protein
VRSLRRGGEDPARTLKGAANCLSQESESGIRCELLASTHADHFTFFWGDIMSHRHTRAAFAVALTLAPAIAGCGTDTAIFPGGTPTSSSSASSGVSGATSSGSGAGGSTETTGSGGDSTSATTGGGGDAGGRKLALVSVVSGPLSAAQLHSFTAQAGFVSAPDGTEAISTASTVGPCEVRIYTTPPTLGTPMNVDAGVITILGGKVPVTLTPDAQSMYPNVTDPANDLFNGGETLEVEAVGGMVPAFVTSIVASAGIDVTLPLQPPNKGPITLDRTADLVFAWTSGGPGKVILNLNDGAGVKLTCTYDSAAGTGMVPKAALGALAANSKGSFGLAAGNFKTITAGNWTVAIVAGTAKTWNGVYNPQTFTYQASN